MTATRKLDVAREFSKFPAGRYNSDGPYSGQSFRDALVAALGDGVKLIVHLDGTMGYGSSFLEEAFGGLVRLRHFTARELHERMIVESADKSLVVEVWSYIDSATQEDRSSVNLRSS